MEQTKEVTLQEATAYFAEREGFSRLFQGLAERYESLGRFGGTIVLQGLSDPEKEALGGFFRRSFYNQESATLSVADFQKKLRTTKYKDCDMKELTEACCGRPLVWKQAVAADKSAQQAVFFQELARAHGGTPGGDWLLSVFETQVPPYPLLVQEHKKAPKALARKLLLVIEALNRLPAGKEQWQRISGFAAAITGNPHFFDDKESANRLLLYGIGTLYQRPYQAGMNAEERSEILFAGGLLKDDISNSVTCIGLKGIRKDGEAHRGLQGFFLEREPVSLTLLTLSEMKSIEAPGGHVYVVENPTVFGDLMGEATAAAVPLVCSSGQIKLAVTLLLDKLAASGCTLHYSGDFDPEGLLIADRLKKRYKEQLLLWHYDETDYLASKSEEDIGKNRLKQLDRLEDPQLQAIGRLLALEKKAGYQERITPLLRESCRAKVPKMT